MKIKILTIKEVEFMAHMLAKEFLSFDEPIPDFTTRYPDKLESCLLVPFQSYQNISFYKGLIAKAAVLFYLMIKNHPFQNGNKRIAITTLFIFLHKNGKWLEVDSQELYNFAVWVASSPSKLNKETIQAIGKFIKDYLIEIN